MKFTNIKYEEKVIASDDAVLSKIIELNKHLIPQFNHKVLTFNATNVPYCIINGYRRCMTDEIPIKHMYLIISSVKSNDPYVLQDMVKDRIEMIPLLQSVDPIVTFRMNISNTSDVIKSIYSSELISSDNKVYFNRTFKICDLNPNCYIKIDNIKVRRSSGEQDGKFSLCLASYEVDDLSKSSMIVFKNDFDMFIESFGNIEVKDIIKTTNELLTKRLEIIKKNIVNNTIRKINIGEICQYFIEKEGYTIGELLRTYIYQNSDDKIKLINYDSGYPTEKGIILNIIHPNHKELIINSIDKIIMDVNAFATNLIK